MTQRTNQEIYEEALDTPILVSAYALEDVVRAVALAGRADYTSDPYCHGRTSEALHNLKRANPRLAAVVRHILLNEGAKP